MKPSWDDAPEWANWLAMDGDGEWIWYKDEPYWEGIDAQWHVDTDDTPLTESAGYGPDCDGEDWDFAYSTLESRP